MAHVGLWGTILLVLVVGLAGLLRPTPKAKAAPRPPEATTAPEGVAEIFVSAWLRAGDGNEALLAPYYPAMVDLRGIAARPDLAVTTASVAARQVGPDYWSITVAADTGSSGRPRYYQVGIHRIEGLYVATALPAEVPAPIGIARSPRLAVGTLDSMDLTDPIALAVDRFLAAMLTGDGELSRYIAPGAKIIPVRPVPYGHVEMRRMAMRELPGPPRAAEVLAEVVATSPTRTAVLQYPLRMAVRQGRWEVAAILSASALSTSQPEGSPATTIEPSGSSSSLPSTSTTGRPASSTTTTRPLGR